MLLLMLMAVMLPLIIWWIQLESAMAMVRSTVLGMLLRQTQSCYNDGDKMRGDSRKKFTQQCIDIRQSWYEGDNEGDNLCNAPLTTLKCIAKILGSLHSCVPVLHKWAFFVQQCNAMQVTAMQCNAGGDGAIRCNAL